MKKTFRHLFIINHQTQICTHCFVANAVKQAKDKNTRRQLHGENIHASESLCKHALALTYTGEQECTLPKSTKAPEKIPST